MKSEHLHNIIEIMEFGYMNNRFISVNFEGKSCSQLVGIAQRGCMPAQQNFQNA